MSRRDQPDTWAIILQGRHFLPARGVAPRDGLLLRDCAFYGVVCVGGRRAEGVRGVPVTGIVLAKTPLVLFYEGCDLRFKERRNGRYRNLRPVDIGTLCGRDIGLAGLSVLDPPIAEEIVRPIDPAAQRRRFIGGKL